MRLIERLLQGLDTYFQTGDGKVFFLSDMVTLVNSAEHESREGFEIEALVDADSGPPYDVPQPVLFSRRDIRIVLTSSPKDSKTRNWLKQLGESAGKTFLMDIWTQQEFVVVG